MTSTKDDSLQANGDDDDSAVLVVPDEAIRWMVQNCGSNVELAALSNVSAQWRDVVSTAMHENIIRSYSNYLAEQDDAVENGASNVGDGGGGGGGGGCGTSCSRIKLAAQFPFAKLLLPEMAMELLERRRAAMMLDDNAGTETLVPISGGDSDEEAERHKEEEEKESDASDNGKAAADDSSEQTDGQFCLAWFAPSGIQIQSVRVGGDGDDHSVSSSSSEGIPDTDDRSSISAPFVPSGQDTYDLSETEEVAVDDRGANARRIRGEAAAASAGDKGGSGSGGGGGSSGALARGCDPAPTGSIGLSGHKSPMRRTGRPPVRMPISRARDVARSPKGGRHTAEDRSGRLQTCALGWSSYRSAMDVLLPFGFTTSFVRVSYLLSFCCDSRYICYAFVTLQLIMYRPDLVHYLFFDFNDRVFWIMHWRCRRCTGAQVEMKESMVSPTVRARVARSKIS